MSKEDITTVTQEEEDEIIQFTFKRSHLYTALLPVFFLIGLGVGFLLWGRVSGEPSTAAAPAVTMAGGA